MNDYAAGGKFNTQMNISPASSGSDGIPNLLPSAQEPFGGGPTLNLTTPFAGKIISSADILSKSITEIASAWMTALTGANLPQGIVPVHGDTVPSPSAATEGLQGANVGMNTDMGK